MLYCCICRCWTVTNCIMERNGFMEECRMAALLLRSWCIRTHHSRTVHSLYVKVTRLLVKSACHSGNHTCLLLHCYISHFVSLVILHLLTVTLLHKSACHSGNYTCLLLHCYTSHFVSLVILHLLTVMLAVYNTAVVWAVLHVTDVYAVIDCDTVSLELWNCGNACMCILNWSCCRSWNF